MGARWREKQCGRAACLGLLWSGVGFAAVMFPINYGLKAPEGIAEWMAYGGMGIYIGALLYFDILLFRVRSPGANRLMRRYWGLSALGLALWLLGGRPVWNAEQGGVLVTFLLVCALTSLFFCASFEPFLCIRWGMEYNDDGQYHDRPPPVFGAVPIFLSAPVERG